MTAAMSDGFRLESRNLPATGLRISPTPPTLHPTTGVPLSRASPSANGQPSVRLVVTSKSTCFSQALGSTHPLNSAKSYLFSSWDFRLPNPARQILQGTVFRTSSMTRKNSSGSFSTLSRPRNPMVGRCRWSKVGNKTRGVALKGLG